MTRPFDYVLVLAGGRSRRLGVSKAWLEWEGTPLLVHVAGRLAPLAGGAVLVAARRGQRLPPGEWDRVDDPLEDAGPLAGLAAGLGAVAPRFPEARFVVAACDYPFAEPALYRALGTALDSTVDVVVPRYEGRLHPLQAVWRARAAGACAQALAAGERRVRAALERLEVCTLDFAGAGGSLDPALALLNVNDSDALARARAAARERFARDGAPSPRFPPAPPTATR